jgi:hypothetical protein
MQWLSMQLQEVAGLQSRKQRIRRGLELERIRLERCNSRFQLMRDLRWSLVGWKFYRFTKPNCHRTRTNEESALLLQLK